jgi:hypothetical protein
LSQDLHFGLPAKLIYTLPPRVASPQSAIAAPALDDPKQPVS